MRTLVVVLALIFGVMAHAQEEDARAWRLGLGLGVDTRLQSQLSPNYTEPRSVGQWSARMGYKDWGLSLEYSQEKARSNSGSYEVATSTQSFGLWASYQLRLTSRWKPFFTAGYGRQLETIDSRYQSASASRTGARDFWGLGGGVRATYFSHWFVEGQVRGALIQDRPRITPSLVLSSGFVF